MKLDINRLLKMSVPETVADFMTAHGTNHQLLLKAWKDPENSIFHNDLDTLVSCLAYEMQKSTPKKAIVARLRGRISKVRQKQETFDFDAYFNPQLEFLL